MESQISWMKRTTCDTVLYSAVFLWTVGWAKAGSVRVQPIQNCSQHPRITVLRDGKPATAIAVDVYRPVDHPTAAHFRDGVGRHLRTDSKGEVVLQKLPPGMVEVVALWNSGSITVPDMEASLTIRYFPEDPQAEDHFTMVLEPTPNDPQHLEQTARDAEQKPIAEHVKHFDGTIVDPVGTAVPNVSIEVARLHVAGARRVRKVRSNAEGHFGALLPAGDYVAIFADSGFRETVDTFTIDTSAKQKDMRVLLQPGAVAE